MSTKNQKIVSNSDNDEKILYCGEHTRGVRLIDISLKTNEYINSLV